MLVCATLLARIPNANCHCHEKKKTSESAPCPFGQLRALGSLLTLSPLLVAQVERLVVDWLVNFCEFEQLYLSVFEYSSAARAPPHL